MKNRDGVVMNTWKKFLSDGVEVVGYDGYEIQVADLRASPGFFVSHVAKKAWATPAIVDGLRALASEFDQE